MTQYKPMDKKAAVPVVLVGIAVALVAFAGFLAIGELSGFLKIVQNPEMGYPIVGYKPSITVSSDGCAATVQYDYKLPLKDSTNTLSYPQPRRWEMGNTLYRYDDYEWKVTQCVVYDNDGTKKTYGITCTGNVSNTVFSGHPYHDTHSGSFSVTWAGTLKDMTTRGASPCKATSSGTSSGTSSTGFVAPITGTGSELMPTVTFWDKLWYWVKWVLGMEL